MGLLKQLIAFVIVLLILLAFRLGSMTEPGKASQASITKGAAPPPPVTLLSVKRDGLERTMTQE